MKPKSTLTEKDYQNIIHDLIKAESPGDYLNGCEADYLPVNEDFYSLLYNAIQKAKHPFIKEINGVLALNPERTLEEVYSWFPDLSKLVDLEKMVSHRDYLRAKDRKRKAIISGAKMALKLGADPVINIWDAQSQLLDDSWRFAGNTLKHFNTAFTLEEQAGVFDEILLYYTSLNPDKERLDDARTLVKRLVTGEQPTTSKTNKPNLPHEVTTFEGLFKAPETSQRVLKAMQRLEVINEAGKWIYSNKKKGIIPAIWKALKTRDNLVHDIPDKKAIQIIAKHIGTTISDRTLYNYSYHADEFLKDFLSVL